jgi:hypothetical protein
MAEHLGMQLLALPPTTQYASDAQNVPGDDGITSHRTRHVAVDAA